MANLSEQADNLNWLVETFVKRVRGVLDAIVVSSDGLAIALSEGLGQGGAHQLAAVASGLTSLSDGAAKCFGGGNVQQIIVELAGGYMFFMTIADGSALAVLCDRRCDVGLVGYEMALLSKRVGTVITPALIAEMHSNLTKV